MKHILVVTTNLAWCDKLRREFSKGDKDLRLDVVSNLMAAYSRAEQIKPCLAIVADNFSRLPEFTMIKKLFSALDTRWVRLNDTSAAARNTDFRSPEIDETGLFEIDTSHHISATRRRLIAMVWMRPTNGLRQKTPYRCAPSPHSDTLVLLGASTGGMDALSEIFSTFDGNCPPTFVVQHTGKDFGSGMIQSLDRICGAKVVAARNGLRVTKGMICVAAGLRLHMRIAPTRPFKAWLAAGDPVAGHLPSIDVLFSSAVTHAPSVVAGLLTGMGRDGAQGLAELRKAGARTFAQDEESSTVYGMPKAAWEIGAAEARIPLSKISDHISRIGHRAGQLNGRT